MDRGTLIERVTPNGNQGVGKIQNGQGLAPIEGVIPDGNEGIGKIQYSQFLAILEGIVADFG